MASKVDALYHQDIPKNDQLCLHTVHMMCFFKLSKRTDFCLRSDPNRNGRTRKILKNPIRAQPSCLPLAVLVPLLDQFTTPSCRYLMADATCFSKLDAMPRHKCFFLNKRPPTTCYCWVSRVKQDFSICIFSCRYIQKDTRWRNKQRSLVFCSRGVTARQG